MPVLFRWGPKIKKIQHHPTDIDSMSTFSLQPHRAAVWEEFLADFVEMVTTSLDQSAPPKKEWQSNFYPTLPYPVTDFDLSGSLTDVEEFYGNPTDESSRQIIRMFILVSPTFSNDMELYIFRFKLIYLMWFSFSFFYFFIWPSSLFCGCPLLSTSDRSYTQWGQLPLP